VTRSEVGRQGEQEYVEGKTILDYVGTAGGPAPRAKRSETVILRGNTQATAAEKPEILPVKLDRLLAGKEPASSVKIQPGDVIFIPSASMRGWQDVAQASFSLLTLATGLAIFNRR
jgi:protein involved in polysaccharide export with SLBB domain